MGCDIHSFAEKKDDRGVFQTLDCSAFERRAYGVFGFLAGVRNYSAVREISAPRGMPDDASVLTRKEYEAWDCDAHSPSWLTVQELSAFDYDAQVEDRRVTRRVAGGWTDGGCTAEPGDGLETTWREFLGDDFFEDLKELQAMEAYRIVFWFDN